MATKTTIRKRRRRRSEGGEQISSRVKIGSGSKGVRSKVTGKILVIHSCVVNSATKGADTGRMGFQHVRLLTDLGLKRCHMLIRSGEVATPWQK
jgi:uncharacterized metal-binding protein